MDSMHMLLAMQEILYYSAMGVCVITIPMLIVGLLVSIIQAATQINEMTLTFIPKFIVMFVMLFLLSPWFMRQLIFIMNKFMQNLPMYIG